MDQTKRKLSFNQSSAEKIKNLRNELNQSRSSIENLSNEFFYEIFDYLDGCAIYQAFSNLNHRFHQLLNSSSLQFKIKYNPLISEDIFMNNWKQMIHLNRQQIFSINLWMSSCTNGFVSSFIIDSSLNHLESLVLDNLDSDVLMQILFKLNFLPRLFSLSIYAFNDLTNPTDIYRIVLKLSMLKYYKFRTHSSDLSVSLPIVTSQQFSSIEHLVIDHPCTFNELFTVISYTPQLRRLNLMDMLHGNPNVGIISSTALSNLIHFSIHVYNLTFDTFEIFIRKINFQLKVLRITESDDITYLDAYRWEKLILKYLPQLETFLLQYYERADEEHKYQIYSGGSNQFSSSFWIQRHWVFEAEITSEHIKYSVHPYRKRWYEYTQDNIINSSIEFSKSARLSLTYMTDEERDEVVPVDIKRVLTVEQIYHLEIPEEKIFIGTLIQAINVLAELDTLKIYSLSLDQPRNLCFEELVIFCSTEGTSKITKVYLEEMNEMKDIYFLMALCPFMVYLIVNFINDMDIKSYLLNIFKKINHDRNNHLRLLCFQVSSADDQMIKELEEWINSEKLVLDYTIQRVVNKIYLQWK